jgi:hypothetical protein
LKLNRELLRDLMSAISDAVAASERVSKIVSDARAKGVDIDLHLDAAITLAPWPADVPPHGQRFLTSAHLRVDVDEPPDG